MFDTPAKIIESAMIDSRLSNVAHADVWTDVPGYAKIISISGSTQTRSAAARCKWVAVATVVGVGSAFADTDVVGTWEFVDISPVDVQESNPYGIAARKYRSTEDAVFVIGAEKRADTEPLHIIAEAHLRLLAKAPSRVPAVPLTIILTEMEQTSADGGITGPDVDSTSEVREGG